MNILKRLAALLANSTLLGGASPALPPRDGNGVVVYARGPHGEVDDASIDRQVEVCTDYAEAKGLRVEATYADRGRCRTDGTLNEGLDWLVRDAGRGMFKIVVVENLDRVARDLGSLETFFRTLQAHGVSIHVPGRGALQAEDVFMRGLMDDEQRRLIAERVRCGSGRAIRKAGISGATGPSHAGMPIFDRVAAVIDPETGRRRTIRRTLLEWIGISVPETRDVGEGTMRQVRPRRTPKA